MSAPTPTSAVNPQWVYRAPVVRQPVAAAPPPEAEWPWRDGVTALRCEPGRVIFEYDGGQP